jgi:hypothetical protein
MTRIVSNREQPSRADSRPQKRAIRAAIKSFASSQPETCPVCCVQPAAEVHHIIPKGMGGDRRSEVEANWIFICSKCHDGFHRGHIPLACILRAKKDTSNYDPVVLADLAGHRLPELIVLSAPNNQP